VSAPLLEVRGLVKHFQVGGGITGSSRKVVRAVDGVSLTVDEGETLGLVGESGCGKSTLVRTILFLEEPTSGEVVFRGEVLTPKLVRDLRRGAQIIFQDPYSSLPPRMKVGSIIGEPLTIHGIAKGSAQVERVHELLADVGLKPTDADKLPHQLSGGQRQRVSIARALAVRPSLVVADEAVSSLDVSMQAQILNLLKDLQERYRLAYLFVSHDLGVVRYMSHRIAVMYLGSIVETASSRDLYERPLHPYTQALMSAAPSVHAPKGGRVKLIGEPPDPSNPPSGCRFHPRCPVARPVCSTDRPALVEWLDGRDAACHFALQTDPTSAA